ncbi:MAG: flagellar basal-body rod protein FlgG [Limisphaerales bacterium]|nr:MAG: flagellar basal-body rod protein FlgG [Limisphaerales bacterium]KAG0507111.1 MAG: flagellar basal-body rod protein FlgG [Limisphaerales bacterium]TXT49315.1 MAG: flagellar basal-body rod protein FlgG [Limisphaerales bacterium]
MDLSLPLQPCSWSEGKQNTTRQILLPRFVRRWNELPATSLQGANSLGNPAVGPLAHPLLNNLAMNVSLFQAAAAMNASSRWQELIAENLSASSIPGFKKQDISFSAVEAGLMAARGANGAQPLPFTLPRMDGYTNFSNGEMKFTGVKTDTAIDGAGFFEVQLPSGTTGYTRDGEFHVDAQGQLVTKSGMPVMGSNGTIQLDPNDPNPISIAPNGDISQGAARKGRLKVVEFNSPQLLTPLGGGMFGAMDSKLQGGDSSRASIRQGFLEAANTSAVTEMANMITAMRHFEANHRLVQLQDERMGKAISELAGN